MSIGFGGGNNQVTRELHIGVVIRNAFDDTTAATAFSTSTTPEKDVEQDEDNARASGYGHRSPDKAAPVATAPLPKAVLQISLKFSICIQNLSGLGMEVTDLSTERCYFLDADPVIESQTVVYV